MRSFWRGNKKLMTSEEECKCCLMSAFWKLIFPIPKQTGFSICRRICHQNGDDIITNNSDGGEPLNSNKNSNALHWLHQVQYIEELGQRSDKTGNTWLAVHVQRIEKGLLCQCVSDKEQGWCRGETAHLPPVCSAFHSQTQNHKWIKFFWFSPLLQEVFLWILRFPPLLKDNNWFDLIWLSVICFNCVNWSSVCLIYTQPYKLPSFNPIMSIQYKGYYLYILEPSSLHDKIFANPIYLLKHSLHMLVLQEELRYPAN